jgi:hypothetical protein
MTHWKAAQQDPARSNMDRYTLKEISFNEELATATKNNIGMF